MPIIQVQHRRSSLNRDQKAAIAARLTDLLLAMEGGAHTEGGKAFATVLFNAVDDADWWVGGRTDDHYIHPPGAFLVTVTIPEGYMNQAHKNEVHAGATAALMEVLAPEQPALAGTSILVMINEIPEGNWGAGGAPDQYCLDRRHCRPRPFRRSLCLGTFILCCESTALQCCAIPNGHWRVTAI